MTIWVLGGDARSRYAAQHLQDSGYEVESFGVPERADTPLPEVLRCAVLPFPSFQGAALRGQSMLSAEDILHRTQDNSHIFGGCFGAWEEVFSARGAVVHELYNTEPLTTANAVPTAEGAICLAIEFSALTIDGAKCLVVGFGRCGKALALRLKALHASVTVSARNPSDLALARTMGLQTDETGIWRSSLKQYDFIFNTVPAPVFTQEQLGMISPDCVMIELASAPGGLAAQRMPNYHLAPALPGRFSPKTAGILYAKSILSILEREHIT